MRFCNVSRPSISLILFRLRLRLSNRLLFPATTTIISNLSLLASQVVSQTHHPISPNSTISAIKFPLKQTLVNPSNPSKPLKLSTLQSSTFNSLKCFNPFNCSKLVKEGLLERSRRSRFVKWAKEVRDESRLVGRRRVRREEGRPVRKEMRLFDLRECEWACQRGHEEETKTAKEKRTNQPHPNPVTTPST